MKKVKLILKEENIEYDFNRIRNAKDVIEFMNSIEQMNLLAEETTFLICLNTKNEIVAYSEIAKGGIDQCPIDIKTIFKTVLSSNANKFILIHNHPSGDSTPSQADKNITKRIKQASDIMNIEFLDHIVIAGDKFTSCMIERW